MLIGAAGDDGRFVPNTGMINNLSFSIDVRQAEASVPADKERILAEIEASIHEHLDPVTQALAELDAEQPETGSR